MLQRQRPIVTRPCQQPNPVTLPNASCVGRQQKAGWSPTTRKGPTSILKLVMASDHRPDQQTHQHPPQPNGGTLGGGSSGSAPPISAFWIRQASDSKQLGLAIFRAGWPWSQPPSWSRQQSRRVNLKKKSPAATAPLRARPREAKTINGCRFLLINQRWQAARLRSSAAKASDLSPARASSQIL